MLSLDERASWGHPAVDRAALVELAVGFITGAPVQAPPLRQLVAVLNGRTGIHVGEVEKRGDDIGGIAVHLAARVMNEAQPGEIIVTSTVVESSMGGRNQFSERGIRALKGIDRPWQLFALEPNHRQQNPNTRQPSSRCSALTSQTSSPQVPMGMPALLPARAGPCHSGGAQIMHTELQRPGSQQVRAIGASLKPRFGDD